MWHYLHKNCYKTCQDVKMGEFPRWQSPTTTKFTWNCHKTDKTAKFAWRDVISSATYNQMALNYIGHLIYTYPDANEYCYQYLNYFHFLKKVVLFLFCLICVIDYIAVYTDSNYHITTCV